MKHKPNPPPRHITDYKAEIHGSYIGIHLGCDVFQNRNGKWYRFYHPQGIMRMGVTWVFYQNPGFIPRAPDGMTPGSRLRWIEKQTEGRIPRHEYCDDDDDDDDDEQEEQITEPNSVVLTELLVPRANRPSKADFSYIRKRLREFAGENPDRIVEQEGKSRRGSTSRKLQRGLVVAEQCGKEAGRAGERKVNCLKRKREEPCVALRRSKRLSIKRAEAEAEAAS